MQASASTVAESLPQRPHRSGELPGRGVGDCVEFPGQRRIPLPQRGIVGLCGGAARAWMANWAASISDGSSAAATAR